MTFNRYKGHCMIEELMLDLSMGFVKIAYFCSLCVTERKMKRGCMCGQVD